MDRLELARRLADAAARVPGVAEVTGGAAVTEYGTGGRVPGVALSGQQQRLHATVCIKARYAADLDLQRLGHEVRRAVQAAVGTQQPPVVEGVDVVVADVVFEEEPAQ